ncbi:hypothetical protein, partial [Candidatus Ichthyocystis sparus]|uniref:hypothetical protein n=1 Tax=Candidatus Ichthyocystis sparus TaxID=1561004 RepID=UPI000B10DCE7
TGNKLVDFWSSLDRAILNAILSVFAERWDALSVRFSVSFFVPLDTEDEEELVILCGEDFVGTCARAGASSSSRFASVTGGTGVQVPHSSGDYVDLFGLRVLPGVKVMVSILIHEISALARYAYSSTIEKQVLSALGRLTDSERRAWLTSNRMLYRTGFMAMCLIEYHRGLCADFIRSLFNARPGDISGQGLLSLGGNSLRNFWLLLDNAISEALESIFAAAWGVFADRFCVSLEPEEGSSSTVLCGRDFVRAHSVVGVPVLATSVAMRGRVARMVVPSRVASRVAGGSSASDSSYVVGSSSASVAGGSSAGTSSVSSVVGSSSASVAGGSSAGTSSVVSTPVEAKESTTITKSGPFSGSKPLGGPKKFLMSRYYSAGVASSSFGMSSSVSSVSSVSAGPLSSTSVGMDSVSSVVTTTTTTPTTTAAYTYSGDEDIGGRLAALMNRDLPPSPPPASESAPDEGEASSSSRRGGGGRRKRKRKSFK